VEFKFTLPTTGIFDQQRGELPLQSNDVYASLKMSAPAVANEKQLESAPSVEFEPQLLKRLGRGRLKVMILDDEAIYRNGLVAMLQRIKSLGPKLDILVATNSESALDLAAEAPDFAIFDYDLGLNSLNGVDTARLLLAKLPHLKICIHSNRLASGILAEAIEIGATFLAKPMTKAHFMKFILDHLPTDQDGLPHTLSLPLSTENQEEGGIVAVIDDSPLFRQMWLQKNQSRKLITFESPEAFWEHAELHADFFDSLGFIITDQYFGDSSEFDGLEFARQIKGKRVFLATSAGSDMQPLPEGISGILPKKIMEWDEMQEFCTS
jgi:CheY-like chemotaxis protein